MAKENDIFGGFTQVFNDLSMSGNASTRREDEMDTDNPGSDESEIEEISPEELEARMLEDTVDEDEKEETTEDEVDDEVIEEDPKEEEDITDIDDDVTEEEIVDTFFSLFSKELGWESDEEEGPKSIKALVAFMDNIIAESSKPAYHSEEVKKLDEFVKQGGNLRDFYNATRSGVDTSNIDLSKESNQKLVLKEYLKAMEYSDTYIDKKLNRYEESGVLEEEAEDALELLKEYNTKKEQKLLKDQEKHYEEQVKQQQKFIGDVQSTIQSSDTILGVKLNTAQKKELIDYLFKVGADGRTGYQKDYVSDPKALIETAFLLKEKENIFKKIETKANTDVVNNLRKKIKNNKNKGKQQKAYESRSGGHFNMISAINSQLSNT